MEKFMKQLYHLKFLSSPNVNLIIFMFTLTSFIIGIISVLIKSSFAKVWTVSEFKRNLPIDEVILLSKYFQKPKINFFFGQTRNFQII